MLLKDFMAKMEQIAPRSLALDFDNPGLLIGPERTDIHSVLLALDCTTEVAREAAERNVDLVLTHHPLFFHPVKHILPDDPETAAAWRLIRHGIGLYAAHTNLDMARGGVSDGLCSLFRLGEVTPFGDVGLGRVGLLREPRLLMELATLAGDLLHTRVSFSGPGDRLVRRVAVVGGAGGSEIAFAKAAGADVLLTGEVKHNEAVAANEIGLPLILAGHYETERIILPALQNRLQNPLNDVQYQIARSDRSPVVQV